MIWLKSGSSQAMTIAFGVAQFGRFGVVCLALFRFVGVVFLVVCRFCLRMGFQRWVSFSVWLLLVEVLQELIVGSSVLTPHSNFLFGLHF